MQRVSCLQCGAVVLVEKNSLAQTSVQWTGDSGRCAEFTERLARLGPPRTALIPTCEQLRESIDDAVRNGVLQVPEW
ncbi:hypothetical protein [Actinomadura sp. NTSP31]|uniref:hypothetical protein n=1 Tax=Actinomadura sp. NTSP31 TaxID=1735447 RepID=UPI0035C137C8